MARLRCRRCVLIAGRSTIGRGQVGVGKQQGAGQVSDEQGVGQISDQGVGQVGDQGAGQDSEKRARWRWAGCVQVGRERERKKDVLTSIESTIGVKQGSPLSPTLFGLYIDEITSFIDHFGGEGSPLDDLIMQILLYVDDIVLLSSSVEGL